jgi:hypothetical protein
MIEMSPCGPVTADTERVRRLLGPMHQLVELARSLLPTYQ